MDLSRMYRIAETGDVNDPTPVDNVLRMAEERQRQQQQARPQSAWGRFKNFAGSNAGRTLWGGLGTALGVGLTGGNLQDALGYGVIGAGNTVGTLNQNRQYANRLALKQQERADALAKEQRDNRFRLGLQDRALEKSKQLADYQLDKTLARLRGEQEIKDTAEKAARQRKIDAINSNPYLTEDQKQWQIARLDGLNFDRGAYYTDTLSRDPNNQEALGYFVNQRQLQNMLKSPAEKLAAAAGIAKDGGLALDPEAANKGEISYITKPQSLSGEMQAYKEMVQRGIDPQIALIASGLNKLEYNVGLESVKAGLDRGTHAANAETDYGYETKGAYRDAGIKQQQTLLEEDLKRGFEVFKTTLPAASVIEANQTAQALQKEGYKVTAGDILFNNYKQAVLANANTVAGINKIVADTQKVNRELSQPYLSPVEEARAKEEAKLQAQDEHEKEKAARQKKAMLPTVKYAINRARDALKEGTGLGQIGGWGWTNGQGGINRADIQNAKAQMNIFMRSLLKEMGVGSKEMDAATEAVAYRYEIDPMMPEKQISRVLDNFMEDYANGTLEKNLSTEAQKHAGNGGGNSAQASKVPTDDSVVDYTYYFKRR